MTTICDPILSLFTSLRMDLRDILESFFGSNHNRHDFDQDFDDFESHISRDFEDIARTFGQVFEIFNRSSIFDDLNDSNRWQQLDTQYKSPRDLMMKSNEEITSDRHLDTDFEQRGKNSFNDLMNKRIDWEPNIQTKSFTKTYFYTSFDNNGRAEEQTTTNDEFGNTETSVTQRFGDRWVTKVVKKNNKNEIIETREVKNFDGADLDQSRPRTRTEMLFESEVPKSEALVEQPKYESKPSLIRYFVDYWLKRFTG